MPGTHAHSATCGATRWEIVRNSSSPLSVAADGYLDWICNQLHRQPSYHGGDDLRKKTYVLFRTSIDTRPVRLK